MAYLAAGDRGVVAIDGDVDRFGDETNAAIGVSELQTTWGLAHERVVIRPVTGCTDEIGDTIAVMGYDDQEIAQHLSPGLSTVLLPHREMGQWCVKEILAAKETVHAERMNCPVVYRSSHRSM